MAAAEQSLTAASRALPVAELLEALSVAELLELSCASELEPGAVALLVAEALVEAEADVSPEVDDADELPLVDVLVPEADELLLVELPFVDGWLTRPVMTPTKAAFVSSSGGGKLPVPV